MKIFEGTPKGEYGEKVNFVDENNVFVGYDTEQSCCEHADWFIASEVANTIPEKCAEAGELEGWKFDPEYFNKVDYIEDGDEDYKYNLFDEGGMVVFRLVNGEQEKFLHLFNCHNGYYGHGFEMKISEKMKHEGCL